MDGHPGYPKDKRPLTEGKETQWVEAHGSGSLFSVLLKSSILMNAFSYCFFLRDIRDVLRSTIGLVVRTSS
jgi:hypothetical protein